MADAFGIDWGAIQTPNILSSYLKGQQFRMDREDNVLARRRLDQQDARQTRVDTRQDQVWQREDAGRALEKNVLGAYGRGDKAGARQAALAGGDPKLLDVINGLDENGRKQMATQVSAMGEVAYGAQSVPYAQRRAYIQSNADRLRAAGIADDRIAGFDPTDNNLRSAVTDTLSIKEKLELADKYSKPVEFDPTKTYAVHDNPLEGPPQAAGGGAPMSGPSLRGNSAMPPNTDDTWQRMIQRESGGRPGVLGPQTAYGQAQGMTQMLPATAQAMAQKLGVPWRSELMTGKTPEAAAYQEKLGRAYYDEGLERYNGDPAKAAQYYHGGPNEKLWGPKTRAYSEAVAPGNMRGGPAGDEIGGPSQIPGYRMIQAGQPKGVERWVDLPGGGQRNTLTGETKNVPAPKPGRLSATALREQNDSLNALQSASSINGRLARVTGMIDSGKLDLGVAKNVVSRAQNAIGVSSDTSRNFASFRADLEKMRNDSLRLNKGVQTEGDAQRAWNELLTNLNDPELVKQRLGEIQGYNEQAIAFHQDMVAQIRDDAGMPPIDTKRFLAKPARPPAVGGGRPTAGGGGKRPPLSAFQR